MNPAHNTTKTGATPASEKRERPSRFSTLLLLLHATAPDDYVLHSNVLALSPSFLARVPLPDLAASDLPGVDLAAVRAVVIEGDSIAPYHLQAIKDKRDELSMRSLEGISLPTHAGAIPPNCFIGCSWLKRFEAPAATSVEANAFNGAGFSNIHLPSVATIGERAFVHCDRLTAARFPSVASITGREAFRGCDRLIVAHFPRLRETGKYMFWECTALKTASFPAVETIAEGAFRVTGLVIARFPAASRVHPAAFSGCSSLLAVDLPLAKVVDKNAFSYCYRLNVANIPSATTLGPRAFAECLSLTEVRLGNSPVRVDATAFEGLATSPLSREKA
jgi:hypothetical protein